MKTIENIMKTIEKILNKFSYYVIACLFFVLFYPHILAATREEKRLKKYERERKHIKEQKRKKRNSKNK